MTNKEYLGRYKKIERELFALEEEQRAVRNHMYSLQACSYDDSPKNPNKNISAKFEGIVEKLMAIDEEVTVKIDKMVDARREISKAINAVEDDTLRTLLRHRYLCGKTFEQIAVDLGISWRWTIELHGRALQKIKIKSSL